MAEVALFHSILGVTAGVEDAAQRLRAAGHVVYVMNLYEHGITFGHYDEAQRHVEALGGYRELLRRTLVAVHHLPTQLVYAGFSNGGVSAEYLAVARPGARGALLMHAAMPLDVLGRFGERPMHAWPRSVPVQVHYSADDPFKRQDWLDAFTASVRIVGAPYDFHEYPGGGHLFADRGRPDEYNAGSAEMMWRRVHDFLDDIDETIAEGASG